MEIQFIRTNVEKISEVIYEASTNVADAYAESSTHENNYESISPEQIATALNQFVDIIIIGRSGFRRNFGWNPRIAQGG